MKFLVAIVRLSLIGLLALVVVGVVILLCHKWVERTSRNRLYDSAEQIPKRKAALVLGCAKVLPNGRNNTFFYHRINAASSLFHAGKCEYLIVSGDNSRKAYDEPTDMQQALIQKGIPESRIYRDFAGFRTLDSVVRSKEVFGQSELIVVSQAFHNKRAIFLADRFDIDAIGLNCTEVTSLGGLKTNLREYLARVKMVLDVFVLRTPPKYLGPKVALGGPTPKPT